jgi:hypothetical protein
MYYTDNFVTFFKIPVIDKNILKISWAASLSFTTVLFFSVQVQLIFIHSTQPFIYKQICFTTKWYIFQLVIMPS